MSSNYILFSPPYNEEVGGAIVLHRLCHTLNELGCSAFLWPMDKPIVSSIRKKISRRLRKVDKKFNQFSAYNTPIAKYSDLKDNSIIIYPEIINGNPLGGCNVVRWLLHKPGFHTGEVDYGEEDLIYFFDENCIDEKYYIDRKNILFTISLHSAYNMKGASTRSGSCYMMRKGKGRKLVHDLKYSTNIDGLDHQSTAEVFKQSKYFYCYDEMTMYSQFAALCGCISIVIPEKFETREEWVDKHPISKYGIAYGMDDIDHAVNTQHSVVEYFQDLEKESYKSIKSFIINTQLHFN